MGEANVIYYNLLRDKSFDAALTQETEPPRNRGAKRQRRQEAEPPREAERPARAWPAISMPVNFREERVSCQES